MKQRPGIKSALFKRLLSIASAAVLTCSVLPAIPMVSSALDSPDILAGQFSLPVVSLSAPNDMSKERYTDVSIRVYDENGEENIAETDISVRYRGNSSFMLPKKSYKIKFPAKQNPLGIGDGAAKTWVLLASAMDLTQLRNRAAMMIGNSFTDMPFTPNNRAVELYLNGAYQGVYLLQEAVSVSKSRVQIKEDPTQIEQTGYLLEMTRYAAENSFTADIYDFEVKSELSEDPGLCEQQIAYIADYTEKALHALRTGKQSEAEKYIDIPSLVDNCIVNEICKNADIGWDSYYFSKDADGKLTFHPIWDFDIAFGNCIFAYMYSDPKGEGIYAVSDMNENSNPWICYALKSPWFRERLLSRWDEMLPEVQKVPAAVAAEAEAYADSYGRDYQFWVEAQRNISGYAKGQHNESYDELAAELVQWITERIEWLDAYYHTQDFADGIFLDQYGETLKSNNQIYLNLVMLCDHPPADSELSFSISANDAEWGRSYSFSQLALVAGMTYQISFDCQASGDTEIGCMFSGQSDALAEVLDRRIPAPKEKETVSIVFTADQTMKDTSLDIVLYGYGTLHAENVSLSVYADAPASGDLNADGQCSAEDATLLQKWLLADPDAALADWHAGDLNGDGVLTAIDLSMLKSLCIK